MTSPSASSADRAARSREARRAAPHPGPNTLGEPERRVLAAWAADCAERALPFFLAAAPDDPAPAAAIEGARAFARGELRIGAARALAVAAHAAARRVDDPAARAAARAAGHAVAVAHMASHALGVAYAALAVAAADPEQPDAADQELEWQVARAGAEVRAALGRLPVRPDGRGLLGLVHQLQGGLRSEPV